MSKKNFIPIVIAVLFLAIIMVYMVNAIFDESRYFSKNSIDYYLLTPKVIKDFPLPSESKEIRYYYSSGDGTKPTSNGVTIIKKTPFDSIYLKNAKIFLQKKNFTATNKKSIKKAVIYKRKTGEELWLLVGEEKGNHSVLIVDYFGM
jgi:hypothetical protein